MDQATHLMMKELVQRATQQRQAEIRAEQEKEQLETSHLSTISEDEVRSGIIPSLLQEQQNLYLNPTQTKAFLKGGSEYLIPKVPLRQRILQVGEKVTVLTEYEEYSAEVVHAQRLDTDPKMGFTNLTIRKL